MFAIVFDLGTNSEVYGGPTWNNACTQDRDFLRKRGFDRQQDGTSVGVETVDAVSRVLTIQDPTAEFDRFAPSARDIRMLRIEDNTDLMPAVERIAKRRSN
ncbi:virulence factor [Aureimonas mangrovi]|uniref:virulence factor n=1 Tax=Aureimonas mangrovi TaxID=2758041 RepID=UPI001AEE1071|nr:virulence factor [Aureimonas mangrovi]